MARLFKRACAVTVARPLSQSQLTVVDLPPNATVIENLRAAFRVEKNLGSEPNSAEVWLYNLAEQTRGEMQRVPLYVRIDAGHDGQLQRLFTGDLRPGSGKSQRRGVLWETKLELGDGERAYKYARLNRSYRGGVDARTAINEIAKSMGAAVTFTTDTAQVLRAQYTSGLTLHGPAHRELSRILAPHGLTWSMQDGRLQVIRSTEVRPDQAILVSQSTGMIGVPEYGTPEKKGSPPTLHVKMLLHPGLTPGGRIKVEAESVQGTFRIERVVHAGDTHGDEWYSEVEAKAQVSARSAQLGWVRPAV